MKPVLVISHVTCEHPGYLCEFLDQRNVHYKKLHIEHGATVPGQLDNVAGLAFLGAPVSVNDPLTWIDDEITLIKLALETSIPMLGICFGAQLMAKAMGGEVCSAPSMQIGWHPVTLTQQGKSILRSAGVPDHFVTFEWHGDTFSIPHGAVSLFGGECIEHQGFLYKNGLAVQFHPEITETMVHKWLTRYAHCLERPTPCIQSRDEILRNIGSRLAAQRIVADKLFGWWLDRVYEYSAGSPKQITRR